MAGASLSKWPAAVMVSGLVANGTLSFDDLASKHLPWWTTDASDSRSRVTLRHLLSFTSGWTADPAFVPKCATCKAGKTVHEQGYCPKKGSSQKRVQIDGKSVQAARNRVPPDLAAHIGRAMLQAWRGCRAGKGA